MITPRTGIAFDAHQIEAGKDCYIAGLLFPDDDGCEGHSDGDVVAHVVVDALLAAAKLGDLGSLVGVGRPEYDGVSGLQLIKEARELLEAEGFEIGNVSAQLIAQTPKMGPRRLEAEEVLTEAVGAPVSVAATTTDRMGFTGSGQGRAALATAIVWKVEG